MDPADVGICMWGEDLPAPQCPKWGAASVAPVHHHTVRPVRCAKEVLLERAMLAQGPYVTSVTSLSLPTKPRQRCEVTPGRQE